MVHFNFYESRKNSAAGDFIQNFSSCQVFSHSVVVGTWIFPNAATILGE